jgi:hypothetical protein
MWWVMEVGVGNSRPWSIDDYLTADGGGSIYLCMVLIESTSSGDQLSVRRRIRQ